MYLQHHVTNPVLFRNIRERSCFITNVLLPPTNQHKYVEPGKRRKMRKKGEKGIKIQKRKTNKGRKPWEVPIERDRDRRTYVCT